MIFRIIAFCVLLQFGYACMRVTVSLDALVHQGGAFQVGVMMSLLALFPTFLAMPFGRWMDRAGARKPILAGAACLAAAALIPFSFPMARCGIVPLYLCCILDGIGFMCIQMASLQMMGSLSRPEHRTDAFSWLAVGFAASGLCAPVLSGYTIDLFGHRWAYALALLAIALGFSLFVLNLKVVPASWGEVKKRNRRGGAFELLGHPKLRVVLIVSAIVSVAWELENFMFPVYGHEIGLSATQIGWLIGSFYSATFIVRFLMPVLSRRIGPWSFMVFVLSAGAAAYAAFPFFTSLPPLLAVAFVLGLGLGASQPNVMTLLHNNAPAGRVGEALGIRTMMRNAAHTIVPVCFGAITAAIGVFWIFIAQAALMGGSALLVHFRDRSEG
ncbi:MFS transporter [Mesosutterella sp. AGMB02718]|uniref:MFS transporter n=1 Tax=Mesosutterella faecium TaxID=2925194 RepID=A0ABT7ILW6_9BURK|nr:MFS transporter [Mesosutterella sp. AGMB02718]MDL2059348.1 MFS transporter [Mesosutterella sp. AGMB02718]